MNDGVIKTFSQVVVHIVQTIASQDTISNADSGLPHFTEPTMSKPVQFEGTSYMNILVVLRVWHT